MKYISLFIGCMLTVSMLAQNGAPMQPTIMPIPFTKENRSSRATFEGDELARVSITKVKEAFDNLGVNTIDFRAKLKQIGNNDILEEDQKVDLKDELIRMSGADIYVEVEANRNRSNSGNSVTVILTAFDAFSGESLANKVSTSPQFYTNAYEKLAEKAVDAVIEDFLATIQVKFDDIRENGRTMVLTIGVDAMAEFDMDSEFGEDGMFLSDIIEDYVAKQAYKGKYHMQGMTSNKVIFDMVKVPLVDDRGRPYRTSRFAANLRKFLQVHNINTSRDIQGQNVVITLSEGE
jgi:hypothetical protein